ncbi:MAG: hypothetical protein ACRDJH_14405 [Thermomicrobiales bacterium]
MSLQNYLADELVVQRQAELLQDAERRVAMKSLARPRTVVLRTGAWRQRIGAIMINAGQRIQGPVSTPPPIARLQGGSSAAPSLRLF